MNRLLILLACLAVILGASATDTGNAILNERVRSLQVIRTGQRFPHPGPPAMVLGEERGITISFDVLSDERDYLRYELIHCNADWQPSSLAYIEYLDGFNEGTVDDYAFSEATSVHYVHYTLTIPNNDMRPLVSGNYLLRIYEEGSGSGQPWLQCRFVVTEQTAAVGANMTSRTDVDYNRAHQQLEVAVNVERAEVSDIFNDLTIVIEQNGRTDNRRVITKPMRVSGKTLYYEHQPELIFKAGNEYRRFETVSTHFTPMNVEAVEWQSPYYHFLLATDGSRAGESYHYDETLSGAYVVREYNAADSDTGADYTVVHFSLDYPETPGFDFYIDGDFVQRRFSPEARMTYNRHTERYERAMLLKQGAYSYQYLAVPPGSSVGRTDIIEGDKYETRNNYTIYVYNRRRGERYDRLVGIGRL